MIPLVDFRELLLALGMIGHGRGRPEEHTIDLICVETWHRRWPRFTRALSFLVLSHGIRPINQISLQNPTRIIVNDPV